MAEQQDLLQDDDTSELIDGILGADDEDLPRERWPQQLAELVDVTVAALRREGVEETEALRLAEVVVLAQAMYFGGHQFYLPKGEKLVTALTHARIFHEHTGRNVPELARKYALTTRQIQHIYRQQLLYRRGRRQFPLFGDQS